MSYVLAFGGFALLIILHEAGHFLAAKAVGMRVERFALFFPPLIARVRRGETEYAIGALPLGGYVRITGMNPHEAIPADVAHRAYYRQPVWKRIVVIAAGPAVNIVIAFIVFAALFMSEGRVGDPISRVAQVTPGTPAAKVLKPGDTLVAVDGKRGGPDVLRAQLATHDCDGAPRAGCQGEPARLTILREGREFVAFAAPRYDAEVKRPLLGFAFDFERLDVGAWEALKLSVTVNWEVTKATVSGITRLFYDPQARDEVSGVVGSYEATRQSFELDTERALRVLGLISLSLAVINLFPFLPLDGGHIFWALAEKVRRKPVPFAWLERVSVVGFVLVIMLFLIGFTNDLDRLSGEGFGVR